MNRLIAYAMLTHHALNELYNDEDGCCPDCCTPCYALMFLEQENVLDSIVLNWEEYDDGTKVFDVPPSWWIDGKVDRDWLYGSWEHCPNNRHSTNWQRLPTKTPLITDGGRKIETSQSL